MSTLLILNRSIQKTNIWVKDINSELGWFTFQRSYLALRAVLHALRDRLTTAEIAQLGAQLPVFIRGIYYEGWNPAHTPVKSRGKELFLRQVRAEFAHTRNPDVDAEHITKAVFRVLSKHISHGELEQIKSLLPREIREYWPELKTVAA
jgi:uncharacterized protein (DUF2267 family)